MKKEHVDALINLLAPIVVACHGLSNQVKAAESVFKRHSLDLYEEYRKELIDEMRMRGDQATANAIALENLRKVLLTN